LKNFLKKEKTSIQFQLEPGILSMHTQKNIRQDSVLAGDSAHRRQK
jgi:hypothetical protein